MKKLWSGIKSIISNKDFTASSINKIKDENGKRTSDPVKVFNILNSFFVKVAYNITRKMPRTPKLPLDLLVIQIKYFSKIQYFFSYHLYRSR